MKKIIKRIFAPLAAVTLFAPAASANWQNPNSFQSPQQWYRNNPQMFNAPRQGTPMVGHPQQGAWIPPGQQRPQQNQWAGGQQQQQRPQQQQQRPGGPGQQQQGGPGRTQEGFSWTAGLSHLTTSYGFDMNTVGSVLEWSDVSWNVFDASGRFVQDGWMFEGGFRYGMQHGTSRMTDDDVTHGGVFVNLGDPTNQIWAQQRILSIGESRNGSMFGFNAGIGLTDKLALGRFRVTPSVGWRHLNYTLTTENNHAIAVTGNSCIDEAGQRWCPVGILTQNPDGTFVTDGQGNLVYDIQPGDAFSVFQPGVSHRYDVTWSGPYVALDFESDINANNRIEGRIELGLPGYHAIGDQPFRTDWGQPVEDRAGIFGATHIGLSANYVTAITDSLMLSIGVNYDSYRVRGADATTFLNRNHFHDLVDNGFMTQGELDDLLAECPNYQCELRGEVNSFFRSIGFRIGLASRF